MFFPIDSSKEVISCLFTNHSKCTWCTNFWGCNFSSHKYLFCCKLRPVRTVAHSKKSSVKKVAFSNDFFWQRKMCKFVTSISNFYLASQTWITEFFLIPRYIPCNKLHRIFQVSLKINKLFLFLPWRHFARNKH